MRRRTGDDDVACARRKVGLDRNIDIKAFARNFGRKRVCRRGVLVDQEHAADVQLMTQGRELNASLCAAAPDGRDLRLRSSEIMCGDCRSGSRALDGDLDRVEQRNRRAGRCVEQKDRALDGRQTARRAVVREIAVDLEGGITGTDRQAPGLDMKAAAVGRDMHRRRKDRAAFGVHAKCRCDGVNVLAERHQRREVPARQDDKWGRGGVHANHLDKRALRRSWTERRLPLACISLGLARIPTTVALQEVDLLPPRVIAGTGTSQHC